MEMFRESPVYVQGAYSTLQARVQGAVIVPGDADYDSTRMAWNLSFQHHPAVIVVAENAADVVEAVRFARAEEMEIAVQATGHGFVRGADGSMLIITSKMTGVHVNPEAQTAYVEGGVKWGKVLELAQAEGLAPLLGSSPDVGAVGYTLGGGIGWLARKYGLSADSVNYFDIVTADGVLRRASASENSDLFWALRGGGGSFGVVVGMEIRLYPVTMVYAGNLFYPITAAKEVYARFREWIANAPDELTTSVSLMNYPPIPDVPEFLRGQSFVIVRGAYTGRMEDGEELLRYWREWQAPVIDMFGPLPFTQADKISNDPVDPMPAFVTSIWLKDLDDEAVDTILEYMNPASGLIFTEVRYVGGGAIARVDPDSAAYSNRDASLVMETVGVAPTPEIFQALDAYANAYKKALEPHATGRVYMNFLEGEEKQRRTKDAYRPENYRRLTVIKAKYDPQNVFSHSFAIPPKAN